MTIERDRHILRVSDLPELDSAHSPELSSALLAVMPQGVQDIELDLSQTPAVDCTGISALIGLRKRVRQYSPAARVCLRNASPAIERLLQLTRLEHEFPLRRS